MSSKITVKCPTCHHSFEVNLDDYKALRVVYKDTNQHQQQMAEYRFKCPRDDTYFIVPVTIEE